MIVRLRVYGGAIRFRVYGGVTSAGGGGAQQWRRASVTARVCFGGTRDCVHHHASYVGSRAMLTDQRAAPRRRAAVGQVFFCGIHQEVRAESHEHSKAAPFCNGPRRRAMARPTKPFLGRAAATGRAAAAI